MIDTSTPERRQLRETVADFLDRSGGTTSVRAAMTSETGYDTSLWRRAVEELGLTTLAAPDRCGGLGLGFADAVVPVEEFGRRLVPAPLLDTVVAAAVLAECGTEAADGLLRRIAEDGTTVAVALAEPDTGWSVDGLACTAGAGGELVGSKRNVVHGATADVLLVVAGEPSGALGLYTVDSGAPGMARRRRVALDQTRTLADVELSGAAATLVSPPGAGQPLVELTDDLMLTGLAAESAAAARACLTATVEYLTVRTQFGRPIGSFQALKHRCADLAVAVAEAEATAWYAATVAEPAERRLVAALAKAVCADALLRVAAESVQLHGGIGFTYEHDAHLFLKRGKANQLLFGSGPRLRARVAGLAGLSRDPAVG